MNMFTQENGSLNNEGLIPQNGFFEINSTNIDLLKGNWFDQALGLLEERMGIDNDLNVNLSDFGDKIKRENMHIFLGLEEREVKALVTMAPFVSKDGQVYAYVINNLVKAIESEIKTEEMILKTLEIVPDDIEYILAWVDLSNKRHKALIRAYEHIGFAHYEGDSQTWNNCNKYPLFIEKDMLKINILKRLNK